MVVFTDLCVGISVDNFPIELSSLSFVFRSAASAVAVVVAVTE